MKINIPITKAVLGDEDKLAIGKTLDTGWIVQGPNVAKFQELFSEFTKSKYAHATTSCTTALHVGLEALGIKAGDKVIVPSFTWISSANAVEYTGAEVVFCDISLKTFNIDETKLQTIIENDKSIKGIMPVNLFGLCANMPAIMELAKKFNLKVIEDSACGFDSWIGEKHSGTFGNCGCFSFHPRKSITTGEGGMVITDDERIANKISQLKDHGADKSNFKRHNEKGGYFLPNFTVKGFNYRMTDIQAALGLSQIERLDEFVARRHAIAKRYDKELGNLPLLIPFQSPDTYSTYHLYPIRLLLRKTSLSQREMHEKMQSLGINVNLHYIPVYRQPYYERLGFKKGYCPEAEKYHEDVISIPIYPSLQDLEQTRVIQIIQELLG